MVADTSWWGELLALLIGGVLSSIGWAVNRRATKRDAERERDLLRQDAESERELRRQDAERNDELQRQSEVRLLSMELQTNWQALDLAVYADDAPSASSLSIGHYRNKRDDLARVLLDSQWVAVRDAYETMIALEGLIQHDSLDDDGFAAQTSEVALNSVENALESLGQPVELRLPAKLKEVEAASDRFAIDAANGLADLRREVDSLSEKARRAEAERSPEMQTLRAIIDGQLAAGVDPGTLSRMFRDRLTAARPEALNAIDEMILSLAALQRLRRDREARNHSD